MSTYGEWQGEATQLIERLAAEAVRKTQREGLSVDELLQDGHCGGGAER